MNKIHTEILNTIISLVEKKYSKDVALICCYGSVINKTSNPKSDLDFYFVPKNEKAYKAAMTFMIDDIGYDFYPLPWARLEQMSEFQDSFVSLLNDSKIVYFSNIKDKKRFLNLRKKLKKKMGKLPDEQMFKLIDEKLNQAKIRYADIMLEKSSISKDRENLGNILIDLSDCLFLLNGKYLKYGIKHHLSEIKALKIIPKNFIKLYNQVFSTNSSIKIKTIASQLIKGIEKEIFSIKEKLEKKHSFKNILPGFYEEASSLWNKIYKACDDKNKELAFFAGLSLQKDLDTVLNILGVKKINFMNSYHSNDLLNYKNKTRLAEKRFLKLLKLHNIPIKTFKNIDEFKRFILNV
jgi:hypothetical protein